MWASNPCSAWKRRAPRREPARASTSPWVKSPPRRTPMPAATTSVSWMPRRWPGCCRRGLCKPRRGSRIWRLTARVVPGPRARTGLRSRRMPSPEPPRQPASRQGIRIAAPDPAGLRTQCRAAHDYLASLGLEAYLVARPDGPQAMHFEASPTLLALAPDRDTTGLHAALGLDTEAGGDDLAREIILAMLLGPVAFPFPDAAELRSAVRIRQHIVRAARRTALAFDTEHAERPAGYWRYDEARGFTIEPGVSLIEALQLATQPQASGKLYSFSCYRATEYVTLLGIAQELRDAHPALYARLQRQWETRAIMSGQFHEVFLREYGSLEQPLPPRYYVPGDRLWFRNPDAHSSNVEGYEGSWLFYLGGGLFNNFWKRDQPYTL